MGCTRVRTKVVKEKQGKIFCAFSVIDTRNMGLMRKQNNGDDKTPVATLFGRIDINLTSDTL